MNRFQAFLFFFYIYFCISTNATSCNLNSIENNTMFDFWSMCGNPRWNSSCPCDWSGITCISNGNESSISEISLMEIINTKVKNFCTIPTSIGLLRELKNINFQRSFFCDFANSGKSLIPTEIGLVTSLKHLGLYHYQPISLCGTIPTEIGLLEDLTTLELYTSFSGSIPTHLALLTSLKRLSLSANLTGEIPKELTLSLKRLTYLSLSLNYFSFPTEIGLLNQLTYLSIQQNKISFGSIPTEIGMLTKLESLLLLNNSLVGTLPTEIGMIGGHLNSFQLTSNSLSGSIPTELGMLQNISVLKFDQNGFTGSIPSTIWRLSQASIIDFSFNQLSGAIPTEIGLFNAASGIFSQISLYFNLLSGPLPTELGMTSLFLLNMGNNPINSTIPNELGNMNFTILDINNCQLYGTIPARKWQEVRSVDLSSNFLSGLLPGETLFGVNTLNLRDNMLDGVSNTNLSEANIRELMLDRNQIDLIPESFFDLTAIVSLTMSNNSLQGLMSPQFALLTSLQVVDFSINNLTGFAQLPISIRQADLSENPFLEGVNPNGAMNSLAVLNLQGTALTSEGLVLQNSEISFIRIDDCPNFMIDLIDGYYAFISESIQYISATGSSPDLRLTRSLHVEPSRFAPFQSYDIYSCPIWTLKGKNIVIRVDPWHWNYDSCVCHDGYYGEPPSCIPCPENAICNGVSVAFFNGSFPVVLTNNSFSFEECPLSDACSHSTDCVVSSNNNNTVPECASSCSEGYENRLCLECVCDDVSNCWFHVDSITCKKCDLQKAFIQFGIAAFVLIVLIFVLALLYRKYRGSLQTLASNLNIGSFKIMTFNLQISILLLPLHSTTFPSSNSQHSAFVSNILTIWHSTLSFLTNISVLGIECLFPKLAEYESSFIWTQMSKVLFWILILIVYSIYRIYKWKKSKTFVELSERDSLLHVTIDDDTNPEFASEKQTFKPTLFQGYAKMALFCVNFSLFSACTSIFSAWSSSADEFDPTSVYLLSHPWIYYADGEAERVRIISIGFGVFYLVLFPAFVTILLLRHLKKATEVGKYILSQFTSSYKPERWWYEMIVTLKRCIIAIVISQTPRELNENNIFPIILIVCLMGSVFIDSLMEPWASTAQNKMAIFCGVMNIAVYALKLTPLSQATVLVFVLQMIVVLVGLFSVVFTKNNATQKV